MTDMPDKDVGGRPLLFKTVEDLKKVIDEYFDWCDNRAVKKVDSDGKEYMISSPAPYTMSGLARRIGIDRQTLINYSKKEEFFGTIRAAREKVHEDVESRMLETRNEKGAIFSLKNNFSWKEQQEIDQNITGGLTILRKSYDSGDDPA